MDPHCSLRLNTCNVTIDGWCDIARGNTEGCNVCNRAVTHVCCMDVQGCGPTNARCSQVLRSWTPETAASNYQHRRPLHRQLTCTATTPPARAQLTQNRKHVHDMHLIVVYHLSSPTRGGSFVSHISEFPYCLAPLEVPLRRPFSHSWSIGQFARVLCNHLDADVVFYYLFLSLVLIL